MSAEWRPIPEWPNYEASSDGHVRSWRVRGFGLGRRAAEPRVFAPWPQAGYRRVHLCADGTLLLECHLLEAIEEMAAVDRHESPSGDARTDGRLMRGPMRGAPTRTRSWRRDPGSARPPITAAGAG